MKTEKLINDLKELWEIEDQNINLNTVLNISSLEALSLIAYIDENFGEQFKSSEIRSVKTIKDIIDLIGVENFE